MSDEPIAAAVPGSLTIETPTGASFRLLDAGLREIKRGTGDYQLTPPPGLYLVEWTSAGTVEQEVAPFTGEESVVLRPPSLSRTKDVGPDAGTGTTIWSQANLAALVDDSLRPPDRLARASVAIVVAASEGVSAAAAGHDIRLVNWQDVAMKSDPDAVAALPTGIGEAVRCYDVGPGRYRLRLRSVAGELLEQSVPALAGRRTIISLQATKANLLLADGEKFTSVDSAGIDPAKSVIVSIVGDEASDRISERIRLAGVLLHDLATGGGSLSSEFVAILDDHLTDPLLKLYGALVVVNCLSAGISPALDAAWPDQEAQQTTFREEWLARAASWAAKPSTAGLPPDATTLWWQLIRIAPQLRDRYDLSGVAKRIEVPPMFEASWRWAVAQSADDPRAVPNTATILATGRSGGGSTPWLCWKTAAAKAATVPLKSSGAADPEELAQSVLTKVQELTTITREAGETALARLSPEARATTMRMLQVAGLAASAVAVGMPSLPGAALVAALVGAFNLPLPQLRRRLARTEHEIESLLATPVEFVVQHPAEKASDDAASGQTAPGLQRPIQWPDDPNKGRFGGRASRRGFRVSARFEETRTRNWTRIIITVRGNVPDGEVAQFSLHDSFIPPERSKEFKGGIAELTVTAWGGFTVGIWIPGRQIELELDLAKCEGAPDNIVSR